MAEIFYWTGQTGDWSDPGIWREADSIESSRPIGGHATTSTPDAEDTVLIPNFFSPGVTGGPVTGGGEAAKVILAPDFPPVTLAGDGDEVYAFGEVVIRDRVLSIRDAILTADSVSVDFLSALGVANAAEATDAAGRSFSAEIGTLSLAAGPPPQFPGPPIPDPLTAFNSHNIYGGTLDLGDHNIIVADFENGNAIRFGDERAGVFGTGAILSPTTQPSPEVIDWNALAAEAEANFLATGQWFVGGAASPEPPPEIIDWNALAAEVQANFAATGQWFA